MSGFPRQDQFGIPLSQKGAASGVAALSATSQIIYPIVDKGGQVFNVKAYGATGNGATDDTVAIAATLTAAGIYGGTVYFPIGTYLVSSALTIPSFVTVRGEGPYGTIISTTSLTADVFYSTGQLIKIADLQIQSLVVRTAGNGINCQAGAAGVTISNVRFMGTWTLGTFVGVATVYMDHIVIVTGYGVTHEGFFFQSCTNVFITDSIGDGGAVALGAGKAYWHFDSGNDTMSMVGVVTVSVAGTGLPLLFTHSLSPSSFAPRWGKFTNCYFEGSHSGVQGNNCIEIDAGLSLYFSNGQCATGSSGVEVGVTLATSDIRFTQWAFLNNWLYGAQVQLGTDVMFDNCDFSDNSTGLTNNVSHLDIGGSAVGVRVMNTYFGNELVGNTPQPSAAISNASADTYVAFCRMAGPFGTSVFTGTAPITLKNEGYNPVGVVTPGVPATTVAVAAVGYDRTFYITTTAATSVTISNGPTIVLPVAGVVAVKVPATKTLTPTYLAAAPTWVVEGE